MPDSIIGAMIGGYKPGMSAGAQDDQHDAVGHSIYRHREALGVKLAEETWPATRST